MHVTAGKNYVFAKKSKLLKMREGKIRSGLQPGVQVPRPGSLQPSPLASRTSSRLRPPEDSWVPPFQELQRFQGPEILKSKKACQITLWAKTFKCLERGKLFKAHIPRIKASMHKTQCIRENCYKFFRILDCIIRPHRLWKKQQMAALFLEEKWLILLNK